MSQKNAADIIEAYGQREEFLNAFNPDVQRTLCPHADACLFGDAPTLAQINAAYGDNTAAIWLTAQLYNLSEYCGVRSKLEGAPLKECASVIASEFYFLKVSEMMLFFFRFKSGRYGRFYGNVDPLVITMALREFLRERSAAYAEHESAEQMRQAADHQANAITYEEYLKTRNDDL